jgi:hypothetical protein
MIAKKIQQGVVAHVYNPSTQEAHYQEDCEFKTGLYRLFKTSLGYRQDPASNKAKQKLERKN